LILGNSYGFTDFGLKVVFTLCSSLPRGNFGRSLRMEKKKVFGVALKSLSKSENQIGETLGVYLWKFVSNRAIFAIKSKTLG
jgi:hypothetical protein